MGKCNGKRFCCQHFHESEIQVCVYIGKHSHPIVTENVNDLDAIEDSDEVSFQSEKEESSPDNYNSSKVEEAIVDNKLNKEYSNCESTN